VPSAPQPWLKPGLRFCGSCALTLVCWALWLVLGGTLAVLLYIATAHDLPVPDFLLRRAESELARAGFALRFGRAHLDPAGIILLEDVRLRSLHFEDPLLTCRLLYVRRDFWSVLAGRPIPDEIRLEGARLQLPAPLSPSGTAEPLIQDAALVLRHRDGRWLLDQFNGRVGTLVLTARGEFSLPAHTPGTQPLSLAELTHRFLQFSRKFALQLRHLEPFEAPALSLTLEPLPGTGAIAHLLLTANSAREPWGRPVTLGPVVATGSVLFGGKDDRPLRLHVTARHVRAGDRFSIDSLRAIFDFMMSAEDLSLRPREALIAAGAVDAQGLSALGPVVRADLNHWPALSATAALSLGGEFIAAQVDAELHEQTARLRATGRGSPALISQVLTRHTPRAAPYFVFGDPVAFSADATLGPGWKFQRLSSRVDARRLDSRGVHITAARGRIDIEGMDFLAHDARVELGDNFATGSYWMNFATSDYRMLLDGRLRPPAINGWFQGDWWLAFWNRHFDFSAEPPTANVDVSGRWRDPSRTAYFGSTLARHATVWNGDFEEATARIFLRPDYTHGLTLSAVRAGGTQRLNGTFRRVGEPGVHDVGRIEFDFTGNVDPAVINRMLDGKAGEVLSSLRLARPPQLHAWGVAGTESAFSFTGAAEDGLHYYGFPLDSAKVSGSVKGGDVHLDSIEFSVAGGKGTGTAALTGPEPQRVLDLDLRIQGAELARALRAVEEFQPAGTSEKSQGGKESAFLQRAGSSRLDLSLVARGRPGAIENFTGSGQFSLTGAELGEIHLFGLLSQVLSAVSLNFTSLKLDAAHSHYNLENGRLFFPDLKVTGRSALIDARGNFTFATKALDFSARLKPYEENRNLITGVIGIVINPLASILELKLTGPLAKPNWSIVVAGSSPKPDSTGQSTKPPPPTPEPTTTSPPST
jgi:hypothetical protein